MSLSSRRRVGTTAVLAGLVAAGLALPAAPASAAPTKVYSPVNYFTQPWADILSATVDYDRARGSLSMRITLRDTPRPGPRGGPSYQFEFYGRDQKNPLVSGGVIGTPPKAALLAPSPTYSGASVSLRSQARYVGRTVTLSATDARLRNLPLRTFDVTASARWVPLVPLD